MSSDPLKDKTTSYLDCIETGASPFLATKNRSGVCALHFKIHLFDLLRTWSPKRLPYIFPRTCVVQEKRALQNPWCPNLLFPNFCHNLKGHDGKTHGFRVRFPPHPFERHEKNHVQIFQNGPKTRCFRVFPGFFPPFSSALGAHQARGWDPGRRGHQPGSMETAEDRQRSGPSGSGVGDGCCEWMVNGEWMLYWHG